MKKVFFAFFIVLLIAMIVSPAISAVDRGKALVVYGGADGDPGAGDQAIGDRLKTLGFTVDFIFAPNTTEAMGKEYILIYLCESITSSDVNTKFTKDECVIITAEAGLYDELQIGDHPQVGDTTAYISRFNVVNDPMKSGLTSFSAFKDTIAETAAFFMSTWTKSVVVLVENDSKAPAVFIVPKGGELLDGTKSAGIRCGWIGVAQTVTEYTDEAWKLFDALVNYTLPVPVETTTETTTAEPAATTSKPAVTTAAQTADLGLVAWIIAAGAVASTGLLALRKRK